MPLPQAEHERLRNMVALAVFASDPLSSVAYATEEILLVCTYPALTSAGALLTDYVLTVAVSAAARCTANHGSGSGVQCRARTTFSRGPQRPGRSDVSIILFLGITYLAFDFGIMPGGDETVARPVLCPPARDDADPVAGREHGVRGLPAAGIDPRTRPFHAAAARPPSRAPTACRPAQSCCLPVTRTPCSRSMPSASSCPSRSPRAAWCGGGCVYEARAGGGAS